MLLQPRSREKDPASKLGRCFNHGLLASAGALDLRRAAEADCQAIKRIHQTDGHRQVNELFLTKDYRCCVEGVIRNVRIGNASHSLRPCKCCLLAVTEQSARFLPDLHQRELSDRNASLHQVARVFVQASRLGISSRLTQTPVWVASISISVINSATAIQLHHSISLLTTKLNPIPHRLELEPERSERRCGREIHLHDLEDGRSEQKSLLPQ